jgi:hypothetical protein
MSKVEESIKVYRKEQLQASVSEYQRSLYSDLNIASDRVVVYGKNMLLLGGVLYVGYTILDRLIEVKIGSIEKKKERGSFDSLNKIILPLVAFALQQGSLTLMKKARIMLVDYLEKQADAKGK